MKLYKLEALRGFAAFYVLLHHTIPAKHVNFGGYNFGFLLRFGQEAVILFFLLSGFVINYSYKKGKNKTFKSYFFKRLFRIYIPLIIVFIVSYLLAVRESGFWIDPQLKTLLLNIVMLQDWEDVKPNVIASAYMGNTPLWSLSYEWWFYMLYFPAMNLLSNYSRHAILYLVVIASTILYVYLPIFPFRILTYMGIWWTGVYISDLYLRGTIRDISSYAIPLTALTLSICILTYSAVLQHNQGTKLLLGLHPILELRHYVFSLFAVIAAIIWMKLNWWGFDNLLKPFLVLAPISYAMYICHLPLMAQASYLSGIENAVARWILYFFCVVTFSWIVEIVIYRTAKNRFFNRIFSNQTLP